MCKPAAPSCLLCPWRGACAALAQGRVDELPPPKARAKKAHLAVAAAWCERGGRILLSRRPGARAVRRALGAALGGGRGR